jgi:radical SAM protein with 4Fe4S-binding SPASM domain
MSDILNLGRGKVNQTTLNTDIEKLTSELTKMILDNEDIFQKLSSKCNNSEKNLWSQFFEKKKFIFPINFHILKFINYHKSNFELIFRYINFRYFFFLVSEKKLITEYPPYLLIEPVSTCNLRCPFCFQTDKSFTKKPFMGVMEFDFFKKIIDEADTLGVGAVTLASRGEPTLHKNLKDMLQYLNTKKNIFEIKLNTNATFLTEELCYEIFNSNVNQVVVSADHFEKKTFEELRKNSNFEKVVKNVDMLFDIRKKIKNPLTEIRISGVDYYKSTDKDKFHKFWIERSDHVSIGDALERWDTYNNAEHPEINDACENLWDRMYIWFDGKVNPCDADYKSLLSYGSAKINSIKDLWKNKTIMNFRENHLNGNRKKLNPCNKCGVTFK